MSEELEERKVETAREAVKALSMMAVTVREDTLLTDEWLDAWTERITQAVKAELAAKPLLLGGRLNYGKCRTKEGITMCSTDGHNRYLAWAMRKPGRAWQLALEQNGVSVVMATMFRGDQKRAERLLWAASHCWIKQAHKKLERSKRKWAAKAEAERAERASGNALAPQENEEQTNKE